MSVIERWRGEFGEEYHKRNKHLSAKELTGRILLWNDIMNVINFEQGKVKKVLEVGAGTGTNVPPILKESTLRKTGIRLDVLEPNEEACKELAKLPVYLFETDWMKFYSGMSYDMIYTSGVLIHVPTTELNKFMTKIVNSTKSSGYVVCIEYFSAEEREVPYRGNAGMLWTRDYGALYSELGLDLVSCKFYYKELTGLDNLTCWIFRKP